MADVSTLVGRDVWGAKCMTYGTWTAGAVTVGDINTKLHRCEQIFLTPTTATAAQCGCTTTLPADGSAIALAFTSNADGYWLAIGDAFA